MKVPGNTQQADRGEFKMMSALHDRYFVWRNQHGRYIFWCQRYGEWRIGGELSANSCQASLASCERSKHGDRCPHEAPRWCAWHHDKWTEIPKFFVVPRALWRRQPEETGGIATVDL